MNEVFSDNLFCDCARKHNRISLTFNYFRFRLDITLNRKEGNDQESIQLPNTLRRRYQRERRTHSVKTLLGESWGLAGGVGGSLNRFYVATTLALSSAVVYTRHLFSPREGFLTHQCNISEREHKNQMNTEMKKQKKKKKKTNKKKTKKNDVDLIARNN